MVEGEIVRKYFATILKGDDYHREGEIIDITDEDIEEILNSGLRLLVKEKKEGFDDYSIWHTYPVCVQKREYKLELTNITLLYGGDRSNRPSWEDEIHHEKHDYNTKDWTDRWP